jgi:hypothetical protein
MSKNALALYENTQVRLADDQLSALEKTVIAQVSFFRRAQPETSMKVVLCGLALRRIKASLKHGQWEPWVKRHLVPILSKNAGRTVRTWMRLADKFVETTKLTLPDFLALPGDQTELALAAETNAGAKRLMARLGKFVGDLGPTELMIKHGVREQEKKARTLGGEKEETPAAAEAARHAITLQDRFNELDQALNTLPDKTVWMSLTKQHHADLRARAHATAAHYDQLWVKTHGREARHEKLKS